MSADATVDEPVAEQETESLDGLQLTAREIAIANDEDPDSIGDDVTEDNQDDDASVDGDGDAVDVASEEPAGDPEPAAPVHSDESVAKAKELGLTDEDIEAFTTPASLRLHVSLLERVEKLSGKTPEAEGESQPGAKEGDSEATDGQPAGDDLPEVINLKDYIGDGENEGWDDPLALNVVRHTERLERRYAELQQRLERLDQAENQRVQSQMLESFHSTVDSLGDDKLFGVGRDQSGRPVKLTQAQIDNRNKLFREADTIAVALQTKAQRDGVAPPNLTWDEVVARARSVAFPNSTAAGGKTRADALRAQSARRRPVSTSAGAARRVADDDSPESLANSPEIVARWEQYQQANGG